MNYFGKTFTREQICARCEPKPIIVHGDEIEISTGRLNFRVLPQRGLDISRATFNSMPLTYNCKNGTDIKEGGFLENFFGGLLTTCGPDNVGPSCAVNGQTLLQHGAHTRTKAQVTTCESVWHGDELYSVLKGRLLFSNMFGRHLTITRTITTKFGCDDINIFDEIENLAFCDDEIMMLYHMNFGYPLLDENLQLKINAGKTISLDNHALPSEHSNFHAPENGYVEQVFVHSEVKDNCAVLENHNIRLKLKYENLPLLVQWKQLGSGDYALGLEPATAPPIGRKAAAEQGLLKKLKPLEKLNIKIKIEVEQC